MGRTGVFSRNWFFMSKTLHRHWRMGKTHFVLSSRKRPHWRSLTGGSAKVIYVPIASFCFLFFRSFVEWGKVAKKRIDERKKIKSFQDQTMNKKVRWNSTMTNNSKTLRMTFAPVSYAAIFMGERCVTTQTNGCERELCALNCKNKDFLLWKWKSTTINSWWLHTSVVEKEIYKPSGPGWSKPDQANPELAGILMSILWLCGEVFCICSVAFCVESE